MNRRQAIPPAQKYTIKQFQPTFPNDDACLEYLMQKRFPAQWRSVWGARWFGSGTGLLESCLNEYDFGYNCRKVSGRCSLNFWSGLHGWFARRHESCGFLRLDGSTGEIQQITEVHFCPV